VNDFKTVPSSIERILSGTWLLALAKINNMIPGLKNNHQTRPKER